VTTVDTPYEFGPPPAGRRVPTDGLRCPACRSLHITADLLPGGDLDIRVVHRAHCRTRRNRVAQRGCELLILDWLVAQGVAVAHYNAPVPQHQHRFLVSA
jgi:hypothetical protein